MTSKRKPMVISTTLYREGSESDAVRAAMAERTVHETLSRGYEMLIVDGGSSPQYFSRLQTAGAVLLAQEEKGMGASRRQAIIAALDRNANALIYLEPEKDALPQHFDAISELLSSWEAEIVVPKRKSLASYPKQQQLTERMGNDYWKQLTGTDMDMFFGPRAWIAEMSGYFLDYQSACGDLWDSLHIPILKMIHDKRRIINLEVDFTYPEEQRAIEEKKSIEYSSKRLKQLAFLNSAARDYWKALKQGYRSK